MSIGQPDKTLKAGQAANTRLSSENHAAEAGGQRHPPFRRIERLIQIGEAPNKGEDRGRWKNSNRYGLPYQADLEEVAVMWTQFSGSSEFEPLWLTAFFDRGDRKAIKPTTLLMHDRTPLHLQVHRPGGGRVEPALEQRSLAPLWRHLSPSPNRMLLQEYAERTIEIGEHKARSEGIEREFAGSGIAPICCTSEPAHIAESIASLQRDLMVIESRLIDSPAACRCRECRP